MGCGRDPAVSKKVSVLRLISTSWFHFFWSFELSRLVPILCLPLEVQAPSLFTLHCFETSKLWHHLFDADLLAPFLFRSTFLWSTRLQACSDGSLCSRLGVRSSVLHPILVLYFSFYIP